MKYLIKIKNLRLSHEGERVFCVICGYIVGHWVAKTDPSAVIALANSAVLWTFMSVMLILLCARLLWLANERGWLRLAARK